jgi:hypothetical protein
LLEPLHYVSGNAAPVIAEFLLPAFPYLGRNLGQNNITGMVAPPKYRTIAGRNRCPGIPLANRGKRSFGVLCAIGGDFDHLTFNSCQHSELHERNYFGDSWR